jgi:hypothetical protein
MRAFLRSKKLWQFTQERPVLQAVEETDEAKAKEAAAIPQKKYEDDKEKHMEAADLLTPRISGHVKLKLVARDFDDGFFMLRHLKEIYAPGA